MAQDGRRRAERDRTDGVERSARHSVRQRVATDDVDVADVSAPELVAETGRPDGVLLQRDDPRGAAGGRKGPRAAPGADLDDEGAGSDGRLRGQCLSEVGSEEVLSETAPSAVPRRPLVRGHGGSPSCPYAPHCATSGPAARRGTGGRWTGSAMASLPPFGPLDLALHIGPHQRLVLPGGLGR